jgi:phosphate transport system protein
LISFEKHAFKGLDTELSSVHLAIQQMAALVSDQLTMLDTALTKGLSDNTEAKLIDKKINGLEIEIESMIAGIFSKYTLIGDELRFAMTMLKLSSTLERMGDMAKNCVKRVVKLVKPIQPNFINETRSLKKLIDQMLNSSISLIIDYNEKKAADLLKQEDQADSIYKKIQLILHQDIGDNARLLETTHMLFIIKNLERMADLTLEIVKLCHYIHHGSKFEMPQEG